MTTMGELATAKTELQAALLKGVKGSRAAERADELIDRYQQALKAAARERNLTEAATKIRTVGDQLGYNTQRAYRRAADLIDPTSEDR